MGLRAGAALWYYNDVGPPAVHFLFKIVHRILCHEFDVSRTPPRSTPLHCDPLRSFTCIIHGHISRLASNDVALAKH